MITEEKRKCFVDEWIEINCNNTKNYYKNLGYKEAKNKEGKVVFKVHPWDLHKGSHIKVKVKCPKCSKVREVGFRNFLKAKTTLCIHCLTIKDLTGKKFGRLTVIKDSGNRANSGSIIWLCKCDCGNFCEVWSHNLLTGGTSSCGCFAKEKSRERLINLNRSKGYFVPQDHTEEEIEKHLLNLKDRRYDFKWIALSKKLRKYGQCKICGNTANLHFHHKNSYQMFPEQRYDEDNLVVLCNKCHMKMHGKLKEITEEAFNKYLEAI